MNRICGGQEVLSVKWTEDIKVNTRHNIKDKKNIQRLKDHWKRLSITLSSIK